ncbi:MAG: hypothetical protein ACFB13_03580 [Kiloniellaceae bacterium]
MQALKALVIFMAVLIVAGMALLVYGLITRTGGGEGAEGAGASGSGIGDLLGQQGAGTPFADLALPVPEGCTIAGTELAGERLVIRLDGLARQGTEGDCQQVLVVDLASGRLLGRVKAVPEVQ